MGEDEDEQAFENVSTSSKTHIIFRSSWRTAVWRAMGATMRTGLHAQRAAGLALCCPVQTPLALMQDVNQIAMTIALRPLKTLATLNVVLNIL